MLKYRVQRRKRQTRWTKLAPWRKPRHLDVPWDVTHHTAYDPRRTRLGKRMAVDY